MKTRQRLVVTAMVVAYFLFCAPASVRAAELYVPSDGFEKIQDAIDAASDGDTIWVDAGTYTERLYFNGKQLTVESMAGPLETVIDANHEGTVVVFDYDNRSTLRGFTLRNGRNAPSPFLPGGGVSINWANPVIENCIITDNEGNQGGGIAAIGGGILKRCKVMRNRSAMQGGGAFSLPFGDPLVMISTLVAENQSDTSGLSDGAGVDGLVVMKNCSVVNNIGGQGMANADNSTVTNTIIYGNEGGQIGSSSVTVAYSNIQDGFPGEGNMNEDPMFESESDGYHISENSPCVDRGTAVGVEDVTEDLDGEKRPFGAGYDIGSDEYTPLAAENILPVVQINGSYKGHVGEPITFDGCASEDPDGTIVWFHWDWNNDGEFEDTTSDCSVTHTWNDTFSGIVVLKVEDDQGGTSQTEVQVEVTPVVGGKRHVYAKLGDQRCRRWYRPDIDIFNFSGEKGEKITLKLKKDRSGKWRGKRAILMLQDRIRGVRFYRADCGSLPGRIKAVLPETGKYRVTLIEYPRWRRWGNSKKFLGSYCLMLKSSKEAWKTLRATRWVESHTVE
jgi:hypothetical protein